MAGSLYLGSQRVCPAIVIGGGSDINVGFDVDQSGKLISQRTGDIVLSGFNDVGDYALYNRFYESSIASADLSNLTTISGYGSCSEMFSGCQSLTSADLSSLKSITGVQACEYMFAGCTSLTSVDLSSLETISGYSSCADMFDGCESLTSLSFPSLKTISNKYAFLSIISWCYGVTIHFPSNMESTISGLSSYPNFGGENTTLLFDLPPTA